MPAAVTCLPAGRFYWASLRPLVGGSGFCPDAAEPTGMPIFIVGILCSTKHRSFIYSDDYSAMKKYEIVLQNKKARIYITISWLIIVFNFIAFIYSVVSGLVKYPVIPITAAVALLILSVTPLLSKRENKFDLLFGVVIITWLLMQFFWPAIINLLLFTQYTVSARRLLVSVSENGINYPSFPKKAFTWNELNNLILKDGLLTIDLKNNKLIQQLTEKRVDTINEKEFNDFCSQQIQSAASAV